MDAMLKYSGHRLIVKHDEGGGGVFAPSPGTNSNIITEYYSQQIVVLPFKYMYVHCTFIASSTPPPPSHPLPSDLQSLAESIAQVRSSEQLDKEAK